MSSKLKGKVAVVTGASNGFGVSHRRDAGSFWRPLRMADQRLLIR